MGWDVHGQIKIKADFITDWKKRNKYHIMLSQKVRKVNMESKLWGY